MSVASEINRIKSNIADAYTEAEAKGATMPATENSANLADTVASIPQGGEGADFNKIGYKSTIVAQNLYDKSTMLYEGYRVTSTGLVAAASAKYVKIPVTSGYYIIFRQDVHPTHSFTKGIMFVDDQDTLIYGAEFEKITYNNGKMCDIILVPDNATYIMFTAKYGVAVDCENTLYMIKGGIFDNILTSKYINSMITPLIGKTWYAIGDSLTEVNSRTNNGYVKRIQEESGFTAFNIGVSGSGWKKTYIPDQSTVKTIKGAFINRLKMIPQNEADYITFMGSVNDLNLSGITNDFGTITDSTMDTIFGAINVTLDYAMENFSTSKIGVISPTPSTKYELTSTTAPATDMRTLVDGMKTICERRGIPFLDLYNRSQLNPWDNEPKSLLYTSPYGVLDVNGIHPNDAGHNLIFKKILSFINSL